MTFCPVCGLKFDRGNYRMLADHFVDQSRASDFRHISWLNRNVSKDLMKAEDLSVSLMTFYHISGGIGKWIITDFVRIQGDSDDVRQERQHHNGTLQLHGIF